MIQIKPTIEHRSFCPDCQTPMLSCGVLWQGIHVCAETVCPKCGLELTEDIEIGQAMFSPFRVDLKTKRLLGEDEKSRSWFGQPLLNSLQQPCLEQVNVRIEKLRNCQGVLLLNCLDFLYGHSLLKLLNADTHLKQNPELGLVLIIPSALRWLVPPGVAEIWTVEVPFKQAQTFHLRLHQKLMDECARFETVYLSPAHSHPSDFEIASFTGIEPHDFRDERFRISFVWREDRLWWSPDMMRRAARHLSSLKAMLLLWQNLRVRRLFSYLRPFFPQASFTVVGLGKTSYFPGWIDDHRVTGFTDEIEKQVCQLYAESRLVIGVHGSNLLLPSAHAGMTIDLIPNDRWGNLAQDVLYQPVSSLSGSVSDPRVLAWRYHYLPLDISTRSLAHIARVMLERVTTVSQYFQAPAKLP